MKRVDVILAVVLFLLIIIAGVTLVLYKSKAGQCLADPLGYARETIKADTAYCLCVAFTDDNKQYIYRSSKDQGNYTPSLFQA